jgi:cytochrome b involved in lipid metabolism
MTTPSKAAGAVLAFGLLAGGAALSVAPATAATKVYTAAQVAKHGTAKNCWTIIGKGVYNLTSWVNQHPGGAGNILSLCGRDGTQAFLAQHGTSGNAVSTLAQFRVGTLRK